MIVIKLLPHTVIPQRPAPKNPLRVGPPFAASAKRDSFGSSMPFSTANLLSFRGPKTLLTRPYPSANLSSPTARKKTAFPIASTRQKLFPNS
jgi:hypothetical protein